MGQSYTEDIEREREREWGGERQGRHEAVPLQKGGFVIISTKGRCSTAMVPV